MQQAPIESTSDDRLWSLLAYILSPIVPIIILVMADKRDRPFIKTHTVQALILGLIVAILGSLLSPVFGIGCLISLAGWIYMIYLGIKANKGELVTIPFLTDFVKGQGW